MSSERSEGVGVVVATSNRGKVRELNRLLAPIECIGLEAFSPFDSAIEDGATFEANAIKKAVHAARTLGRLCLADDSGLVVDGLDGRPGVYSARFAGEGVSDEENWRKVLKELRQDIPRTARFVCCLALAIPDGTTITAIGEVEGRIAESARGSGGFGYDPIFEALEHRRADGSMPTLGEVAAEAKNAVSHRRRAVEKLLADQTAVALLRAAQAT